MAVVWNDFRGRERYESFQTGSVCRVTYKGWTQGDTEPRECRCMVIGRLYRIESSNDCQEVNQIVIRDFSGRFYEIDTMNIINIVRSGVRPPRDEV